MPGNSPIVTVVITSYNREGFLAASIESVLASRFGDYALLIVDDCSSDGSVEVAREYARLDKRIRVVVNETNLGDYPNRNRALGLVETPLLKYHDSDDLMYPHCLEVMVGMLLSEPRASLALSSGRSWPGGPCPMLLTPRLAYQREFLGGGLFFCGASGALFRTEKLRSLRGFPNCGPASDYCLWLKICAVENTLLVPGDLFWYRVHAGQELRRTDAPIHYARARVLAWKALMAPDCPLAAEELPPARRGLMRILVKTVWREGWRKKWPLLRTYFGSGGIPLTEFFRYPPRSPDSRLAGVPVDEQSEFLVPDWVRRKMTRSVEEPDRSNTGTER